MPPIPMRKSPGSRPVDPAAAEAKPASERRDSCRYSVGELRAFLSWSEPVKDDEFGPVPPPPHVPIPAAAVEPPPPAPVQEPSSTPNPAEMRSIVNRMGRAPGFRLNGLVQPPAAPSSPPQTPRAEYRPEAPPPVLLTSLPADCPGQWTRPVVLLSVSQSGLLVLADTAPPLDSLIWFRLEAGEKPEWAEVTMKGSESSARGLLLRLTFHELCPYDLFKEVVLGNPNTRRT